MIFRLKCLDGVADTDFTGKPADTKAGADWLRIQVASEDFRMDGSAKFVIRLRSALSS